MLPEALSEVLGVSLSEVLDQYYSKLDKVKQSRMIGNMLDRKQMGERDQEWLDKESQRQEEVEILSYHWEDDTY
jgi:hypothetical protein